MVVTLRWNDERAWFCRLACASAFAAIPQDFADRLGADDGKFW